MFLESAEPTPWFSRGVFASRASRSRWFLRAASIVGKAPERSRPPSEPRSLHRSTPAPPPQSFHRPGSCSPLRKRESPDQLCCDAGHGAICKGPFSRRIEGSRRHAALGLLVSRRGRSPAIHPGRNHPNLPAPAPVRQAHPVPRPGLRRECPGPFGPGPPRLHRTRGRGCPRSPRSCRGSTRARCAAGFARSGVTRPPVFRVGGPLAGRLALPRRGPRAAAIRRVSHLVKEHLIDQGQPG